MLFFETIKDLQIRDVVDHGVPNLERIAIYVNETCELGQYCLFLGMPGVDGTTAPLKDHMLWFGHGWVHSGDWLFIYTASGTTTVEPNGYAAPGTSIQPRIINIHWGKDHTVFHNRAIVPMLIRMNGLNVPADPKPAYQGSDKSLQSRLF